MPSESRSAEVLLRRGQGVYEDVMTLRAVQRAAPIATSARSRMGAEVREAQTKAFALKVKDRSAFMGVLEQAAADPAATIVGSRRIGGRHVNGVELVTLSNGLEGVWKPTADERIKPLRATVPAGEQSLREPAAYVVDKAMGHRAGVAPTVYRTFDGQDGALSAFVASSGPINLDVPLSRDWPWYRRIALFDHVVGNLDRHRGNLLLMPDGNTVPIDHGLTFPIRNWGHGGFYNFAFKDMVELTAGDEHMLQSLLENPRLADDLAVTLRPAEIDAMYDRVQDIVAEGRTSRVWLRSSRMVLGGDSFD